MQDGFKSTTGGSAINRLEMAINWLSKNTLNLIFAGRIPVCGSLAGTPARAGA
jgi:hypothetical protein